MHVHQRTIHSIVFSKRLKCFQSVRSGCRALLCVATDTSSSRGRELLEKDPMKLAQKIFLTRHGERQDVVDKTWHETAENPGDPPLTKSGIDQAAQLALRLKDEKIHHIYASPFLRTVQTAHEVAEMIDVPVKVEYGLSEGLFTRLFPYGEPRMAGLEELQSQMRLVSLEKCSIWDKLNFPEQRKAVENRVRATCKKILERHKDENILFVGHGLSIHYVLLTLLGDNSEMANIPYCALTECVREHGSDKWDVICLWEDAHIKDRQDVDELRAQAETWQE